MSKKISEERQAAYYLGLGLMILGGLLFVSTFFSFATHFGDFSVGPAFGKSLALRAFGGMALIFIGGIIRGIGARGVAGSGVVLDPEKARDDLEPYARMTGGMLKDALDEADIGIGRKEPERVVMVKCQACGTLNQEAAKFCQECGQKM